MFLKNFHIFIKKRAVLQQKFTVQVTTLADCDDITRFDGTPSVLCWYFDNTIPLPYLYQAFDDKM